MATFFRSDLAFQYSWNATPGDNPRQTGHPDQDLFNRHEGYEVLDFINAFMKKHSLNTTDAGRKIERFIKDVPPSVRGRAHVTAWIETHW